MQITCLTQNEINAFKEHLASEEKSEATIEKYIRDAKAFLSFSKGEISRHTVLAYKKKITEEYAERSVNSMLTSLNMLFDFLGLNELRVKTLKLQQQIYRPAEKELTKAEYQRLCAAAEKKGKMRLSLILQTICATGIRVSELKYITVSAVRKGTVSVRCKGKHRTVFIVKELQKKLLRYTGEQNIKKGEIFITKSGKSLSRSNIWREMKALCKQARVDARKVFPHNLRHLFALTFYAAERDIAKLADILGHSSINTTRIYIVSTGDEHRKKMERLHLVT